MRWALLAASAQTLISVANYFIAQATVAEIPPLATAMLRLGGAAVVLVFVLTWIARRPGAAPLPRGLDLAKICGLGLLGVTTNQTLFLVGIHHTLPSRAVLIYAATPMVVLLIGRLRGTEAVDLRRTVGILGALAGVAVIVVGRGALEGSVRLGDAAILVGMLAWSGYTALGKRLLTEYGAVPVACIAMIAGGVAYVPVGLPALLDAPLAGVSAAAWAGVAWLVFVNSILSYTCWFFAIRHLPPTRVAVFNNLQSPLTLLTAWALFAEPMTASLLGGAALVLTGVALVQRPTEDRPDQTAK